jgi:hypothetical protein
MADSDSSSELGALLTAINNHLPFEIVSKILDYAEFWYCDQSVTLPHLPHQSPRHIVGSEHWGGSKVGAAILTSRPLSHQDISMLRRVTFSFRSKDQGWSSYRDQQGTYDGSWTWWEAGLLSSQERIQLSDTSSVARTYHLQRNRHAGKEMEDYTITLDKWHGHELFEDLCTDDSIVLMAYAQFPGWANHIDSACLQLWMADYRRVPSNGSGGVSDVS